MVIRTLFYNAIFNKLIWITEWNLQMSKTTGNTMLQSLFVCNYFLELLSNYDVDLVLLTAVNYDDLFYSKLIKT